MDKDLRKILLKTARDALNSAVNRLPTQTLKSDNPQLNEHCGCFVTLKNHANLRGCIGQFKADKPLIELVAEMARAAGTRDPRFFSNRITPDELNSLNIEISVLSPLKKTTDPLCLRPGIDGIYITKGNRSGCFLPQVATETGWNAKQFLENCCSHKAALPSDAWKDPDTNVYLFTVDAFEQDFIKI